MRIVPIVLLTTFLALPIAAAQQPERETSPRDRVLTAVERYVDAGTLAVGVIDIDGAWIEGVQQEISGRLGDRGKQVANQPGFAIARGMVESFRAAGAREALGILSANDLQLTGGPIVVLTTTSPESGKTVATLAKSFIQQAPGDLRKLHVAVDDQGRVLVGQQASVERYLALDAAERPDLMAPLAELIEGESAKPQAEADLRQAAAIIAPGADSRRVIRELWPELPAPFAAMTGSLVADDAKHLMLQVTRPPEWTIDGTLVAGSEDSAVKFHKAIDDAYQFAVRRISAAQPELKSVAEQAAKLLAVKQEGTSLTVRVQHDNDEAAKLVQQVLVPAVQDAREQMGRNERMNQMKQLALAMLNFESARRQIPASAAIVDKDGKPLLSWRVAVLPYVEGQTLWEQFHYDEPWDSEHNLKFVQQMPKVFADPMHPELAAEGKTTYQLPVHAESVFPPTAEDVEPEETALLGRKMFLAPGTKYKDITDGISNTVMIVEVPPEDAVIWTKPADWEVDLASAWAQLKGKGGKTTVAAYCDGSARAWDHSEDRMNEELPKMITRAGGEVIER